MRIAIVLKTFTTDRGGAEVWSSAFVKWLVARGHDVHVVASKASADVQRLRVTLHLLPSRSSIRFAASCETLLKTLNADVVHDMGAGWYFDVFQSHVGSLRQYREALLRLMPLRKARLKRIAAAVLPSYWLKNRMMRRQFSDSQHAYYLALSQAIADDFQTVHGISPAKIRVVPNGVDTTRFMPSGKTESRRIVRQSLGAVDDSLVLLLVAQNHELKGLPVMIEAAGRLIQQGRDLWITVVGGLPVPAHLKRIEQLGISSRVNYIGWTDPRPFYHAADVYVHPSHYDACSLGVLEALACGLPVITSAANGAGELVEHGDAGFVLQDARDVASLCKHLVTVTDVQTRRRMAARARRVAEANSLMHNFQRIEDVYREILAERVRGADESRDQPLQKSA